MSEPLAPSPTPQPLPSAAQLAAEIERDLISRYPAPMGDPKDTSQRESYRDFRLCQALWLVMQSRISRTELEWLVGVQAR